MSTFFNRKPYRGGPNFGKLSTLNFDLGGTRFEITVPESLNPILETACIRKSYPLQEEGWFDANCSGPVSRSFIQIYYGTWPYFAKGMNLVKSYLRGVSRYPIGHFSLGVSLCRTESGKTLDLHDPQSLRAYIEWEYHDYFETPAAGRTDCLRGHNYDVRQECERMFPEEERRNHIGKQGQYEIELKNRLKQMPEDFGTADFAGEQWTTFSVGRGMDTTRYFCLPLTERFDLRISLSMGIDFFGWNIDETLSADIRKSTDWILQHIKVTRPGSVAG